MFYTKMKLFKSEKSTAMETPKPALPGWVSKCGLNCNRDVLSQYFSNLWKHVSEYCEESTLHGLKYMSKPSRHLVERIFWLFSFIVSTSLALYLIFELFEDYLNRPLITVFESAAKPLNEIPFPAVSFCNPNALSKNLTLQHINQVLQNPPDAVLNEDQLQTLAKVSDMVEICESKQPKNESIPELLAVKPTLQKYFDNNKDKIGPLSNAFQTTVDLSQKCKELIAYCQWAGTFLGACGDLFTGTVTSFGYCCTYNGIPFADQFEISKVKPEVGEDAGQVAWNVLHNSQMLTYESLLSPDKINKSLDRPIRQAVQGFSLGLRIFLNDGVNDSYCPQPQLDGTVIFVKTQLDAPNDNDKPIFAKRGNILSVRVSPDITLSDESVKSVDIKKRKCYYPNDIKLRWYKHYTQANCMEECGVRIIVNAPSCHCMPTFVPYGDVSVPTCDITNDKWKALCNVPINQRFFHRVDLSDCHHCLPLCTEIKYNTDTTDMPQIPPVTEVRVYMDGDSVYPKLRKQSITIIQLLSNAGGLLGLFMGFSVFSLLELVYYGSLCIRCKRQWKNVKATNHEISEVKVVKLIKVAPYLQ